MERQTPAAVTAQDIVGRRPDLFRPRSNHASGGRLIRLEGPAENPESTGAAAIVDEIALAAQGIADRVTGRWQRGIPRNLEV